MLVTSGKGSSLEFGLPTSSYLVSSKASTLVRVSEMKEEIKCLKNEPTFLSKCQVLVRVWQDKHDVKRFSTFRRGKIAETKKNNGKAAK